jgi:GTP-binding protein HflX
VVSRLHSPDAEILSVEHVENGTKLEVMVREGLAAELEPFLNRG